MDENRTPSEQAGTLASLVKTGTVFDKKECVETFKALIKEGNVDPLAPYTVLKRMVSVAEEVFKDPEVQKIVNNEAEKHMVGNRKSFDLYSATICKMAVYTTFDYSECGHVELDELYNIQKAIEARIKTIEEELKLLIPKKETPTLGIEGDSKTVVIDKMPFLNWADHGDQVVVKAPKKIQKEGLKFMKI